MRDVMEQLESYQSYLDARYPAVTAEDVLEPHTAADRVPLPIERTANVRRSRPGVPAWVAASAAAVLVLIAVGVPILVFGGGDTVVVVEPSTTVDPIVTTVPATTVAPTTTTVPATVPPVVPATPMTWERIDDPVVFGGDGEQRMTDAAAGDGVVVAVGRDKAGGDFDAAVWYSIDGVTWNRVSHDEAVFGGDGHQQINGVVAVEAGFLAVGSEGDDPRPLSPGNPPSDSLETHAAVWRSDDGIEWTRVPHSDALSGGDGGAVMKDVVFDGSGFVAAGGVYQRVEAFAVYRWVTGPTDVDIDVDAAVWTSVDGVVWSRVSGGEDVFGGDTVRQHINGVVVGGPGFVAVGQEGFDFLGFDEWTPDGVGNKTTGRDHIEDNVAAVWTSPDGRIWTRVAQQPALAHLGGAVTGWAAMHDVAATGAGLVAVGEDFGDLTPTNPLGWMGGAAVWLSADGVNWQRAGAGGEPDMHAVIATAGGGLVAGGGNVAHIEAGTWSSLDDGVIWVRHPSDDPLLFGGWPTGRAESEAFGSASIQGLATFGSSIVAVGDFNGDAAAWVGIWNGGTDG